VYFREFLKRPWWRRVWTIQEVALAAHMNWASSAPVLVYCGKDEIPFECVLGGLLELYGYYGMTFEEYFLNNAIWVSGLDAHSIPRRAFAQSPPNLSIESLMRKIRGCSSQDPKDRIYGLYGIFEQARVGIPQPSYLKSTEEIYWEFTVALHEYPESANLMTLVSGLSINISTPSWVPNYAEVPRVSDQIHSPKATKALNSRIVFSNDHRKLFTYGATVDVIQKSSGQTVWVPSTVDSIEEDGPFVNLEEGYAESIRAFRDWYHVLQNNGSLAIYGDHDSGILAFAQSLTHGMTWLSNFRLGTERENNVAAGFWLYLLLGVGEQSDRMSALEEARKQAGIEQYFYGSPERRYLTEDKDWQTLCTLKHHPGTAHLHHLIWMMMRDKTFFVTRHGYMGTAYKSIQDNDVIVQMEGVDQPMVLRPNGESPEEWRVICPAYIEGMMPGELWKEGLKLQKFTLV
jgi:hypothetical protein